MVRRVEAVKVEGTDSDVGEVYSNGEKQCLVGCVIAEKQINKEAFRTTMLNVWRPTGCSI
jgi:hypothetical protein